MYNKAVGHKTKKALFHVVYEDLIYSTRITRITTEGNDMKQGGIRCIITTLSHNILKFIDYIIIQVRHTKKSDDDINQTYTYTI